MANRAKADRVCLTFRGGRAFATALAVVASVVLLTVASFAMGASKASAAEWSVFEDSPYVESTEAIVVDGDGNVIYAHEGETIMSMASVTKTMTAVVALESGISLDTTYVISENVLDISAESSVIGYSLGEEVTLNELLHGLLVHSGNDAAMAIAELVGGSVSGFVDMMNAKAAELGLTNTHFANPHGLDEYGHYSTPADLVKLGVYAMQIPMFASIVGSPSTVVTVAGELVEFASTDALLNSYPGMRGIKTGYTYGAGNAFLGVATRGGQTLYVCVLGAESSATRWADVERLLDWGFSHYPEQTVADSTEGSLGYKTFADRFGWYVATETEATGTLRVSPYESGLTFTKEYMGAGDSLVDLGEHLGQLVWWDGTSIALARSVYSSSTVTNGSQVDTATSNVFFGLDRF